MVGPCSYCGAYAQYCSHQCSSTANTTYLWPVQYDSDFTTSSYASSSPPVDCTLSLGTPSTRLSNFVDYVDTPPPPPPTTSSTPSTTKLRPTSSVSSFCWDLLHPKPASSSSTPLSSRCSPSTAPPHSSSSAVDPLFARRCSNCDTTSTPLWRNGPRGPKSLCNACGIRFKKEERRAAAATTTAANNATSGAGLIDPHQGYYNPGSWAHQYSQGTPQKMQCYGAPNEFRFMDDDRGSDSGIQFLSWLTHDRPSGLVHDFTR